MANGVNTVEGFVNSPPAWMTVSNCTGGNTNGSDNLSSTYYTNFTDYLAQITKHFRDSWGVNFRTLSMFNEPTQGWWTCSNNQEGNHVSAANQETLIADLKSSFSAAGITDTGISSPDEYSSSASKSVLSGYSPAALGSLSQINTHTYNNSGDASLYGFASTMGYRMWTSELAVGDNTSPVPDPTISMNGSLNLAAGIHADLTALKSNGWVYWQAIENSDTTNSYGLIQTPFSSSSQTYTIMKQYYGMEQYSKFIRPGFTIIDASDSNTTAAWNPDTGRVVVVMSNPGSSARSTSLDLSGFSTLPSSASVYQTTSTANFVQLSDAPVSNKALSVTLPAESITTYVIDGTATTAPTNLLSNAGFENSTLSPWTADPSSSTVATTTSNTFSGAQAALITPTSGAWSGLSQTITAPTTGRYTFIAHATSTIANGAQLGVNVAGVQAAKVPVFGGVGYNRYVMTVDATAGQAIKVWGYAPAGGGTLTVDDSSLSVRANYLSNPGFETGALGPWAAEWHPTLAGVENNNPLGGQYDAYLHPTSTSDVGLYQTITAPSTGTYTFRAFVASNIGSGVSLGADVAGTQATSQTVTGDGGYRQYQLTFTATAGQTIKCWIYSSAQSGWVTVDQASLG